MMNRKVEIKNQSVKSLKLKLIAEIEELPKNIKTLGKPKFEVIEIVEKKRKNTKILVLKNDFTTEDIMSLEQWKELKVYYNQF